MKIKHSEKPADPAFYGNRARLIGNSVIPSRSMIAAIFLTMTQSAMACEPMVPLLMIYSGTTFIGRTVTVFVIAIAIKCLTFAILERRLFWPLAIVFMIVANLFSTLIGILVCFGFINPPTILFSIAIVFVLSIKPAARLKKALAFGKLDRWSAARLALMITFLYVVTIVLFCLAEGLLTTGNNLEVYWVMKLIYIYAALIVSIFLTTLWEEWIVGILSRHRQPDISFLKTVLIANLVTLFLVMLYAAVLMVPLRMKSHAFLAFLSH